MIDTAVDYGSQPGIGEALASTDVERNEIYLVAKVEEDEDAFEATRRERNRPNREYLAERFERLRVASYCARRHAGPALEAWCVVRSATLPPVNRPSRVVRSAAWSIDRERGGESTTCPGRRAARSIDRERHGESTTTAKRPRERAH